MVPLEVLPQIAMGRRPKHIYTLTSGGTSRYKLLHNVTEMARGVTDVTALLPPAAHALASQTQLSVTTE